MTDSRGVVLVVEDEPAIADLLRMYLSREGFQVLVEAEGQEALTAVADHRPSCILLDVGLPGMDGIEVCRRLRAQQDWTPVVFCTARDDEVDRVLGLELGADDYITKPFSPREVVARVKAVVRRARGPQAQAQTVRLGKVEMDPMTRRCTVDGRLVDLTATEFDLLFYLMTHPGQIFSRDQLLSEVWGYAAMVNTRTVDVHVAQLRGKLGENNIIRTVRGVGYGAEVSESGHDAQ
ncbi:MAG: response regulator transcription factor [Actinobacteria bacterium]|nr:response regulator transcription factor [Actinomycetota bacterium]MCB8998295.1 response regulator transcription factor [Actinomycetota bacterium]MCB9414976.1 response regulator transcription factor [Actinomycetota bacterium]MCB9424876.1 response regulator transcription factor [Actinomycetota bacterium]